MTILCKVETNEIFLDGVIGDSWDGTGITVSGVTDALSKVQGRPVIRINSPGGSADEGIAIFNLLQRFPDGVDTHNEALAASAASIVFLAGNKRTMERGSKLMIHKAHTIAVGNSKDMAGMANVLAMYDEEMADLYSEFMGVSKDIVIAMMEEETWFDAPDAVESGLATAMAPTVRKKSAAAAAWIKKPPQDLYAEQAVESATKVAKRSFSSLKEREMRLRLSKG